MRLDGESTQKNQKGSNNKYVCDDHPVCLVCHDGPFMDSQRVPGQPYDRVLSTLGCHVETALCSRHTETGEASFLCKFVPLRWWLRATRGSDKHKRSGLGNLQCVHLPVTRRPACLWGDELAWKESEQFEPAVTGLPEHHGVPIGIILPEDHSPQPPSRLPPLRAPPPPFPMVRPALATEDLNKTLARAWPGPKASQLLWTRPSLVSGAALRASVSAF
jgi:hypothetical protein